MTGLGELKISGMGKMNGGKFSHVEITGMGKLFGDVEADDIKISGSGRIEGNAKMNNLDAEGNCYIAGEVESNVLKNSGNMRVGGTVRGNSIVNSGRFAADGTVKARRISSEGYITVNGDVESEEFISDGAFKVKGLLNANNIDIKVKWSSFAREIGGERINVKFSKSNSVNSFILFMFGKGNMFETELIEGTEISLENTKAKIVRGKDIKIGSKCDVELVEYSGTLEIDPGSTVIRQVKI